MYMHRLLATSTTGIHGIGSKRGVCLGQQVVALAGVDGALA